jgi:hypothetical protein
MSQVVKQVVERVRSARVVEQAARDAAVKARHDREEAEAALAPAQREAKTISDASTSLANQRLKALEQSLAQAKAMAAADRSVPSVPLRVRSRMLLVGGTASSDEPFSAAAAITSIASLDRVAGAFLNCQQIGGKLMTWIEENDVDDALYREADKLECQSWAGLKRRIAVLAGESS